MRWPQTGQANLNSLMADPGNISHSRRSGNQDLSNFNPSLGLNFAAASQNLCLSAFSGD
jgi:hypothetical protein